MACLLRLKCRVNNQTDMKYTLFIILALSIGIKATATNYFVSVAGNDGYNGQSSDTPWKSIQKVNSMMSSFQGGDTIFFRRGDTWYELLSITASGQYGNHLVFTSYGTGEIPVISGLEKPDNWVFFQDGIYYAELNTAPGYVFSNNELVSPSRWPAEKAAYSFPDNTGGTDKITDADLTVSGINRGAVCHIKTFRFYIEHHEITGFDDAHTFQFESIQKGQVSADFGYFVTGLTAALDETGEWAYDSEIDRIYYAGDPSGIEVTHRETGIVINKGADFVTIQSIKVTGTNESGLTVKGNSALITNCVFTYNFGTSIEVSHASKVSLISDSVLFSGGSGIEASDAADLTIWNNYIYGTGTFEQDGDIVSGQGEGIKIGSTSNARVQFNHIEKCGRTGIMLYDNQYRGRSISYNLIEDAMLSSDDGGAIYAAPGNNPISAWDTIHHNIIIRSKGSLKGTHYASEEAVGIYIDEPFLGVTQENWIIRDNSISTCSYGIYLHDARNCKIESNLIFDCSSLVLLGDKKQATGDYRMTGIDITDNIFVKEGKGKSLVFVCLNYNDFVFPETSDNNIFANQDDTNMVHYYYHTSGEYGYYSLNQWKTLSGRDQHSVFHQVPLAYDKKLFIPNPVFKNGSILLSESCRYSNVRNEEVIHSVNVGPYRSIMLYGMSTSGTECMVSVTGLKVPEISDTIGNKFFEIYPNPAGNDAAIRILPGISDSSKVNIHLISSRGTMLMNETLNYTGNPRSIPMDLSRYYSGLYFVLLRTGDAYQAEKLIITK